MASRLRRMLRHPLFLCLVTFFCSFCLAILLFLPLEPFARHLEQQAFQQGIELQITAPHLTFPPGLGVEKIQLSHPQIPQRTFQFDTISLSPVWLSLTSNNPGARFKLKGFQGDIRGTAFRDGQLVSTLSDLQFSEPIEQLSLVLDGTLDRGDFDGKVPMQRGTLSRLNLKLSNLFLSGLQKYGMVADRLPIGQVFCTLETDGSLIKIGSLETTGPAFELRGSGEIRIGKPANRSRISLNLILTPRESFPPQLRDLLTLLKRPQPDGSYNLRLRGSLQSPGLE